MPLTPVAGRQDNALSARVGFARQRGIPGPEMTSFMPVSSLPRHMVTPDHVPWNLVTSPFATTALGLLRLTDFTPPEAQGSRT